MPKIELIQGDCLEKMRDIPDGSIDMILCDPPYGTTACKWDSVIPFEPMWEQLNRVIKPNGAIVLFGSEPFSSALRMSNIKNYKYDWIWCKNIKTGSMMAKKRPLKQHEVISVFYKTQSIYNPIMEKRTVEELRKLSKNSLCSSKADENIGESNNKIQKRENMLLKYPTSQLKINGVFNRSSEKVEHPTQKPVALMEYLIKNYTNEGETVLDFCMGSGTTGVACKNLNRNFIGIELDSEYFKIAEKRINENL